MKMVICLELGRLPLEMKSAVRNFAAPGFYLTPILELSLVS